MYFIFNHFYSRLVYKWFYLIYMISYGLGVIGYVIVLLTLLGVNLMFRSSPQPWMDCGLMCLFYGLYYGVLGRDISEIITDKMAATIGVILHSIFPIYTIYKFSTLYFLYINFLNLQELYVINSKSSRK